MTSGPADRQSSASPAAWDRPLHGRTQIVAHRGGAALWPENSLRAVQGAVALGVDAIEVDVHLSADDQVVVIHDPTLDRTLDAMGSVRTMTYAEIKAAPAALDRDGKVPLLSSVCKLLQPTSPSLSIELKSDGDYNRYPGLAARVLEVLSDAGLMERAFVHAFDWTYLEEVKALAPEVHLGASVNAVLHAAFGSWDPLLDALLERGVRDLNADHRLIEAEVIEAAHARGLGVTLWTVNATADLQRFLAAGADHLCTDYPDRALRLRDAYGAGQPLGGQA